MFLPAMLISGVFAAAYFVIGAIFDTHQDRSVVPVLSTAITGFVVGTAANWLYLWMSTPALNVGNKWIMVIVNGLLWAILAGVKNLFAQEGSYEVQINGSSIAFVSFFVVVLVLGICFAIGRPWGSQAYRLAKLPAVHSEPVGAYPDTDTEHIGLMPEAAAQFKADQALTQAQGKYANLSTQYDIGDAAKQQIGGHLYWVFELQINGWRNANRVNRIVPGYVVVDAENTEAQPLLKLGYKMKYTPGAPTSNSLKRLVWNHYKGYTIDDLTLEVNDDWKPYYTASLNNPAYTFGPSVPVKNIIVDPQNGKIQEYNFKDVPQWVDRVYSANAAQRMLDWWGNYGQGSNKTPRKFLGIGETSSNRYEVSGEPVLVYANDAAGGHPEWQMLLTSKRKDTAAIFVALFDARSNNVRLYRVPNLQTETAVTGAFETAKDNVKKFEPTDLSMHKIYGRLTWVAEYIPNDESSGPRSLQALGLLAADDAQGINVQMRGTKSEVLTAYRLWLANSSDNTDPNADSKQSSVSGTITRVSNVVIGGNSAIYITLDSDPHHVFRGSLSDKLPELPFADVGSKVTITYVDVGNATEDIIGYDDTSLSLAAA